MELRRRYRKEAPDQDLTKTERAGIAMRVFIAQIWILQRIGGEL